MNTTLTYNDLPPVERKVSELYAWGMTKKEIAARLHKSVRTIENQIRNVFAKTDTHKDTEFASWYFCTRFGISFNLSPVVRSAVTCLLLAIVTYNIANDVNYKRYGRVRASRSKTKTENFRRGKYEA